jgi:hypothetical protein
MKQRSIVEKKKESRSVANSISNKAATPFQLQVIKSGMYKVDRATNNVDTANLIKTNWDNLNNQLPKAIEEAEKGLNGNLENLTEHQKNYLVQTKKKQDHDPVSWGYCIEEKLTPLAESLGWKSQEILSKSRPDFKTTINGVNVYADLTTFGEAGHSGDHITEKLVRSNVPLKQNTGADIVYDEIPQTSITLPEYLSNALDAFQVHRFCHPSYNKGEDGLYLPEAENEDLPNKRQVIFNWDQQKCIKYTYFVDKELVPKLTNTSYNNENDIALKDHTVEKPIKELKRSARNKGIIKNYNEDSEDSDESESKEIKKSEEPRGRKRNRKKDRRRGSSSEESSKSRSRSRDKSEHAKEHYKKRNKTKSRSPKPNRSEFSEEYD